MSSVTAFETALAAVRIRESEPARAVSCHLERVGVWVLADAVGSKARANRSAERALDAFARAAAQASPRTPSDLEMLRLGTTAANSAVYEDDLPPLASLAFGTSIVAAKVESGRLSVAHLGNARCYRFRAGERCLLTPLHTVLAELRDGDDGSSFAIHHRHLLTRALGLAPEVEPELNEHAVRPGDLLVLVNDALGPATEDSSVANLFVHDATASAVASCIARLGDEQGAEGAIVVVRISESRARHTSSGGH
jgi:serine/threonine protein phosphatase PrpC